MRAPLFYDNGLEYTSFMALQLIILTSHHGELKTTNYRIGFEVGHGTVQSQITEDENSYWYLIWSKTRKYAVKDVYEPRSTALEFKL